MSPQEKRRKRNRQRERENFAQRATLKRIGIHRAPHQSHHSAAMREARSIVTGE